MRMPQNSYTSSLCDTLTAKGDLSDSFVADAGARVAMLDLITGSAIYGRGDELRGLSVLIKTSDQFTAALMLCELDGIARRMVLYPPDMPIKYLPSVIDLAEVDAIVSDEAAFGREYPRVRHFVPCGREIVLQEYDRGLQYQTEWILLTSGTSGPPKLVVHTFSSLTGAIEYGRNPDGRTVWSTFYDIRRYGGLQIFLRAVLTGSSLVLSSPWESTAEFLARAGEHKVTHISGTPSHWRRALMSPTANLIDPGHIRLSGEIADHAILSHLRSFYPHARIAHAFASTEAGVAFEVTDNVAGFPAALISNTPNIEMRIENSSLWIRSARSASRYLGDESSNTLRNAEGFVDTGDLLELRDGRYYFVGRRDGVINVGGLKVHPEEVEAVINRHPRVEMSLVRKKKNPIVGALVVADVVLKTASQADHYDLRELQLDILRFCRDALSSYKVPAAVHIVPSLAISESGKLVRHYA